MQARSTAATTGRHVFGALIEAILVIAVVAALAFAAMIATGRPGSAAGALARSTTEASITLASSGTTARTQPALGTSVAFDTTYASNTKNPRIEVLCYQSGSLVYGEAGSVGHSFVLGGASSVWVETGGSATCQANLFYFYWKGGQQFYKLLASTSFDAAG
jgi:hypothetical protein